MAKQGEEIANPRTGQRTKFLVTASGSDGELLRIETFHPVNGPPEPEHVHPSQESRCAVHRGALDFSINGEVRRVCEGEEVVIPAGVPHFFWNDGEQEAHAIQEFRPALNLENFFETYFALARAGSLDERGLPNLLQLAVLLQAYDAAIRTTKPRRVVQQTLSRTLAPLGRLVGYRA